MRAVIDETLQDQQPTGTLTNRAQGPCPVLTHFAGARLWCGRRLSQSTTQPRKISNRFNNHSWVNLLYCNFVKSSLFVQDRLTELLQARRSLVFRSDLSKTDITPSHYFIAGFVLWEALLCKAGKLKRAKCQDFIFQAIRVTGWCKVYVTASGEFPPIVFHVNSTYMKLSSIGVQSKLEAVLRDDLTHALWIQTPDTVELAQALYDTLGRTHGTFQEMASRHVQVLPSAP